MATASRVWSRVEEDLVRPLGALDIEAIGAPAVLSRRWGD